MKRAFTLIELLVVIAIIAILAAILFPVFAQAKLAAKKIKGVAQMKQLGMALFMYQTDYNDGMPTWDWYYAHYPSGERAANWTAAGSPPSHMRTWDALLFPYVKSGRFGQGVTSPSFSGVWQSPGAEYPPETGRSIGINQLLVWDITRYEDSDCLGPSTNWATGCYIWPNAGQMDSPSNTVFVGDAGTEGRIEPTYFLDGYYSHWVSRAIPHRSAPFRYGDDGANYVFADTHAKFTKADVIYPSPKGDVPDPWYAWDPALRAANGCAAAKYFAPNEPTQELISDRIYSTYGVQCSF